MKRNLFSRTLTLVALAFALVAIQPTSVMFDGDVQALEISEVLQVNSLAVTTVVVQNVDNLIASTDQHLSVQITSQIAHVVDEGVRGDRSTSPGPIAGYNVLKMPNSTAALAPAILSRE